jgi:hypothetical protein
MEARGVITASAASFATSLVPDFTQPDGAAGAVELAGIVALISSTIRQRETPLPAELSQGQATISASVNGKSHLIFWNPHYDDDQP